MSRRGHHFPERFARTCPPVRRPAESGQVDKLPSAIDEHGLTNSATPVAPAIDRAIGSARRLDSERSLIPSRFDDWRAEFDERAAIVEYDGEIPRAWAEGFARLDPDRPPADVPPRRWQRFVDDVGRFLDDGWAAEAAALGWGPLDLFGCDRERPFARIDHAGLLWLLNGDRLVELDRHRAMIETRTGARQSYRRRPVAVGEVVLAWELAEIQMTVTRNADLAAGRMRRLRQRQRDGIVYLGIELRVSKIGRLVALGYLSPDYCGDLEKVRDALYWFLDTQLR